MTILAFLFVLGVLIFVHELGHFLMARRIGVRVLTFSLGFGPKLINFKRGDTEYCISAIPLGGYVKMAGENPEDTRTGAPDEFLSKGKWQRFQVLVMGPVMNLAARRRRDGGRALPGRAVPRSSSTEPVVIGTFAEDSVGGEGRAQAGDRIVTVDGKPVENWDQFSMAIVPKAKRQVTHRLRARRPRQRTSCWCPAAQGKYEMGDIGIQPLIHPRDRRRSRPASRRREAGLQPGDAILAANGEENIQYDRLIAADQRAAKASR